MTEPDERPEGTGRHAAPEGAERHPLIDLSRDPNPGRPDHAAAEED
ncbi:hypothetical protein [Actinokineospora enzanensis]|nr:hypothetical protein [Actinokineospora enzanensis]